MPMFVEDPLIAHNVTLPAAERNQKNAPDISRDEEDDQQDIVKVQDNELKATLLKYGVKAGAIVGETTKYYTLKWQSANGGTGDRLYGYCLLRLPRFHILPLFVYLFYVVNYTLSSSATCRRPIKGAAGRPVQFTYPDLPASPMTLQRQALERCLVTLWAQILVFLILTCLLELIYSAMEHSSAHPFVALLDNLKLLLCLSYFE
uniref:LEM domain-containing protein n=1 Tax=Oncorhynchus mykiss TaxID=8022 RepID=A0A8C7PXT2_ONCMY